MIQQIRIKTKGRFGNPDWREFIKCNWRNHCGPGGQGTKQRWWGSCLPTGLLSNLNRTVAARLCWQGS